MVFIVYLLPYAMLYFNIDCLLYHIIITVQLRFTPLVKFFTLVWEISLKFRFYWILTSYKE